MNYQSLFVFLFSISTTVAIGRTKPVAGNYQLLFIENKGQIKDQNGNTRTDIDYVLPAPNINIFIGSGELHYQFSKTEVTNMHMPGTYKEPLFTGDATDQRYEDPLSATISTYRLDVVLVGANNSAKCIASEQQAYYENYYLPRCPQGGIRSHSYHKIVYKDIYPDIDWVIFIDGKKVEHEFVVGKKGNASLIQVQYKGQSSLSVDKDGNIVAITPMGKVIEKAPVCFTAGGEVINSAYKLKGNTLSYDVSRKSSEAIVIDPELIWGTYYGPDSSTSPFYGIKAFDTGSVYGCGLTWSGTTGSIATVGAHQYVFSGLTDAYLVKFDSSGNRIWATYYGGPDGEWATGIDCDRNGMVYVCGPTSSTTGIATAGSQQSVFGGMPYDAFLVKFGPDGSLKWCTYAGGAGANIPGSVSCDASGKVYLAGDTNETTNIATPAAHQPARAGGFDWYIIQYDTLGTRIWGSYHGGPGNEYNGNACTDGFDTYLTGWTTSATGISSSFGHQIVFGGNTDAALVKYNNSGAFAWATYIGGTNAEKSGGVICDRFYDVYVMGTTESDAVIASPGSFQPTRAGGADAFLMKFHREMGTRLWGTYIGGPMDEYTDFSRLSVDDSANIYVIGSTASTSGVVSDSAWQSVYGGGTMDAFLGKFNRIGARKWCTYYGGSVDDDGRACSYFGEAVYICGQTNSTDGISTAGGFMPVGGSGSTSYNQGYMAKFGDPDTTSIPEDTSTVSLTAPSPVNDIQFSLYPNPNNGTFSLTGKAGTKNGIAEIVITNISGKVILRDKSAIHNGEIKESVIITNNLAAGIYFVNVKYPEIEQTLSFTKQ
ncbi:MAG: T9SS type A sorting domain-containing protein [Taibaiella sp.]|nr:T9SS type A sorting domain-containing protein [Taibaiella sp.]